MSNRSRTRRYAPHAIAVGFIIAVLGIAGVPVVANPLRPATTEISVDFPRTVGLYPESRVLVQGIEAGTVSEVEPSVDKVRVKLKVHDVALAPDATATLRLRSLIGERYVELAPVWSGKGPRLENGAVIPLERTRVPAEVSELFDEGTRIAENVDAEALRSVVTSMAEMLGGNQDALAGVTTGLASVGETLSARASEMDSGLARLQRVVSTLADKDSEITRILKSSTAVSQALLAQEGAFDGAITGLDAMLAELTEFTGREKDKLVEAFDVLDRIGRLLVEHEAGWQRIIDLGPFYGYGWYNAIHHDGTRWWLLEQAQGLFFVPFTHPMNSNGGPGSYADDNRVVPAVDFSCSPLRQQIPWKVDAVTGVTGPGPLLPAGTIADGLITINNDPGGTYTAPGYEGAEREPDQEAPAPRQCPEGGNQGVEVKQ